MSKPRIRVLILSPENDSHWFFSERWNEWCENYTTNKSGQVNYFIYL